ncbi:NUDIX domain-containing protein [Stieleria varia]|uniref:NUDIX domain-containing protein n=1 Tax=Stieleria varia TaxID=2528005 RepID=UPI001E4CE3AF|nr:NUDIX domain-containing protein [Stieleria varia]
MSKDEEHVLVVPESVVNEIGYFEGFEADTAKYLGPILKSDQLSFQPRSKMETDPTFKQLIPYVLLEWTDEQGRLNLFAYTRGGGSGEKRLHAKRSVGIGGHISAEDAEGEGDTYETGMQRELAEEIQLDAEYTHTVEGLIYDPSNDVGKVHLGVVHRFVLTAPHVASNEADLAEGGFVAVDELKSQSESLETWSQLAVAALYS